MVASRGRPDPVLASLGIAGLGLGNIAGQCFNDYFDKEFDMIAAPYRPLPQGRISSRAVLLAGTLALLAGLGIGLIRPLAFIYLMIAVVPIGVLYSKVKQRSIYGPFAISWLNANMVIVPALYLIGTLDTSILLFSASTFVYSFGFNLQHQAADAEVEARLGTKSIPVILGPKVGATLAGIILSLSPVIPLVASIGGIFPDDTLGLALVTLFVLASAAALHVSRPTHDRTRTSSKINRIGMILLALTFLVSVLDLRTTLIIGGVATAVQILIMEYPRYRKFVS